MRKLVLSSHGGLLILALSIAVVPMLASNAYQLRVAALVLVYALSAVGLNVLMGEAGQVSLGHAAFMGIGAYACALGPALFGLHPLAAAGIGALVSIVSAWVIGRPILRLRGYYFTVATLSFGYLFSLVIVNNPSITGGSDGVPVPRMTVLGARLTGATAWYWIAAGVLMLGTWLALNLKSSPSGRAFRALRDSELAAGVLGVDVASRKLAAFTIAAGYASIAGSLLALMNGFASPDSVGFLQSVDLVTMVVVGGIGSAFGAIVGAALLVLAPQAFAAIEDYEAALMGLLIMLFMILLRQGIVPTLRRRLELAPKP